MSNITATGRHSFAKTQSVINYPDFLDIQIQSFQDFFQLETAAENRTDEGLFKVFAENFPIADSRENFVLSFVDYSVDPPKYSVDECIDRGLTYSVPLKAKLRLICNDTDNEDFQTIEQEVFLGNIPYMTERGSFVINGAERVIVSQLHRSPGVFFAQSKHTNGTKLYSARIIPFKGSWIEFATDVNNVMYAYIDRKKKFPVTVLLRAIGYGNDKDILDLFGLAEEIKVDKKIIKGIVGRRLAARVLKTWQEDFVDEDTGEVVSIDRNEILIERDTVITENEVETILESGSSTVILHKDDVNVSDYNIIYNTLQKDTSNSEKEAVEVIYKQLRNTDAPDEQTARDIIQNLFFSDKRYDLGEVGRYRINKKLGHDIPMDVKVLTKEDIISIVKYLIGLINSRAVVDDIDHLSNRRVRTVGEQLYAQFGVGLARMARTIKERMNVRDNEDFKPVDLINARTLSSVINSFFGTNQLSQFMDQTNPLAEITHKRRMSALGPGGLSRERAGFEVRDVHYTHYGRLCTIETPEGPNIGLISSLCVHAKVNSMGFIETPYRIIDGGKVDVSSHVQYLTAEEEDGKNIVQANAPIDIKSGKFLSDRVKARFEGDFPLVNPSEAQYMDVAPNQIVSVAASMIPFLEHDDANRALMGSNMQRQAVPLLRPEAPIVGTGLEHRVAIDSRTLVVAEGDGVIEYVDALKIVVKYDQTEDEKVISFDGPSKSYKLIKFRRTNQDTTINLKPIVFKGERVSKGQALCEGYATQGGELALGRNMKVAFMPWQGYNFEDAIVISEKVVRDDIFTSIHIEEFELEVRDTKRGEEELTSEIPNVSEETVRNLDENGVVRVGSDVKEGDILIGKITPKGESDPTPEEKLLRAIFGDKAGDVKDASKKAPPSLKGVVIDTKLFARPKKDKEEREKSKAELKKVMKQYGRDLLDIRRIMIDKTVALLNGKTSNGIKHKFGTVIVEKGVKFSAKNIEELLFPDKNLYRDESTYAVPEEANLLSDLIVEEATADAELNARFLQLIKNYNIRRNEIAGRFKRERFVLEVGDELPAGIVKLAKVYVAKKRKLKVGDKMAGRHGNKGVVARIVREEDMPFLEDGTPVDIVLNPLGVPSRMNLGQIYETVLGWAGQKLGKRYATPIFDGGTEAEVAAELTLAGLPDWGRTYLYNGLTGDKFDQPVTVGIIYMLKLGHLVDDKMHARSIGPYSLITQQPLGGKAQFGGQRFGEMEVWALEAFGAANILQEILTVKSDDVIGRAKAYEAIVKGENMPKPNIPESFNVLIHELRGLALEITLE
ncbi:DNA-directed RNA polymerase subunit beta [Aquirufa ecclesiirivi]|uniref:DNA-directed RNA polymerase subunit beta n=1 Tax=Aquirufa ecclesiirivi TaxID=2715124 RepID=A0ABT4JGJ3_9BACT|nr:DNA-directed RNA polymerase subunit beta [Aquirufa ecclesiirivi]MCZ2473686.1 DNA-directed RNA polymerase subunit beta [Aquirufa ecclesiirivi]MCZ2474671.1 DNA-directed RNA polymerase subunit beta [Aquirufa ecclesiirivi]MDF0692927.1 DNA-directed RNA polymerase subunit beta [Aquirufa ecclesiirivi]NHC47707.1 DNA-directed RNA polymerase subunit beta [Aquirufa ecclesiirivi]